MGTVLWETFRWTLLGGLFILGVAVACSDEQGNTGQSVPEADENVQQPQQIVVTMVMVETKSVPLPQSMDELIGDADIIAVGRVGRVVREVAEGAFRTPVDREGNPVKETLVPHTYFELDLEQVIKDDGAIAQGGSVLLRMEGRAQEGPVEIGEGEFMEFERDYPMPVTGQRRLFVLVRNPNDSYSSGGVRGLLDIDGDDVRFATGDLSPVPFAAGRTPAQFLADVVESAGTAPGN